MSLSGSTAVDEAASLVAHDDLDLDVIEPAPRSLRLLPKVALLALIFGIVASPALRPAQQEQPKRAWRSTSSESWTHGENEVPVIISVDLLSNDDVRNFVMAQAGVDDVWMANIFSHDAITSVRPMMGVCQAKATAQSPMNLQRNMS